MKFFKSTINVLPHKLESTYHLSVEGKVITTPLALPNDNYQMTLFGQSIGVAVKDGQVYKAWQAPEKRYYKWLPTGFKLPDGFEEGVRKLLEIHFQDAQKTEEWVLAFFKGTKAIELLVDPNGNTVERITIAELEGKTKDELLVIAFKLNLFEYVGSKMTVEEIKTVLTEHLEKS